MAEKNINLLKVVVFARLNDSTDLQTLLKGADHIHHKRPPKKPIYPCVVYEVVSDTDAPFDEDNASGEITEALVVINIFSADTRSTQSDNIEAKIKTLLYKQNIHLTNSDIICYSCLRIGMPNQDHKDKFNLWVTTTRYRVKWAVK